MAVGDDVAVAFSVFQTHWPGLAAYVRRKDDRFEYVGPWFTLVRDAYGGFCGPSAGNSATIHLPEPTADCGDEDADPPADGPAMRRLAGRSLHHFAVALGFSVMLSELARRWRMQLAEIDPSGIRARLVDSCRESVIYQAGLAIASTWRRTDRGAAQAYFMPRIRVAVYSDFPSAPEKVADALADAVAAAGRSYSASVAALRHAPTELPDGRGQLV